MARPATILHLKAADVPACLTCDSCGRRGLVDWPTLERHYPGRSMVPLHDISFRCARCGKRRITLTVPESREEAGRFLTGDKARTRSR